jgi:2'-5' RNA ligase
MALSVCLLLDEAADRAVRRLWRQIEDDGVPTLATHTHRRHVPHLTLASVNGAAADLVRASLGGLPTGEPVPVQFQALGMFTRSRCWLLPSTTATLLARQEAVASALAAAGVDVHRNYRPGSWLPHLTLAPRLHVEQLPLVARRVYQILPLAATLVRAAVVDTADGTIHELPHLV